MVQVYLICVIWVISLNQFLYDIFMLKAVTRSSLFTLHFYDHLNIQGHYCPFTFSNVSPMFAKEIPSRSLNLRYVILFDFDPKNERKWYNQINFLNKSCWLHVEQKILLIQQFKFNMKYEQSTTTINYLTIIMS